MFFLPVARPVLDSAMTPTSIYLSLGSNLGDRAANLRTAIARLPSANLEIHKVSSFYETEPVDYLDQPWFLNCVVEGATDSQPIELLHTLRNIEAQLGSKKAFAKGPRLLDIDILLFGGQSLDTPELQIPHPRMLERKFVLAPFAEIAPQFRHPSWPATASDLLARCGDSSVVRPLK
jgi:2-amino-4-hydroxy-6-hydroxymethyldihydropteridine diphosphokinase